MVQPLPVINTSVERSRVSPTLGRTVHVNSSALGRLDWIIVEDAMVTGGLPFSHGDIVGIAIADKLVERAVRR